MLVPTTSQRYLKILMMAICSFNVQLLVGCGVEFVPFSAGKLPTYPSGLRDMM